MKETLINNKWKLILPDHRAARPEWPFWEKERLSSLHKNIVWGISKFEGNWMIHKKHPVVFDIGAEEGDFPALFSSWGAEVVLFEPNDKVWPNIKAIWLSNNLKPPLGYFAGFASNKNSEDLDQYSFANQGIWPACANGELIGDHGFKELADPGSIQQIKLDYFFERTLLSPDIITIDVEGSEFEVLKGAENILRSKQPIVYVSIHPEFMYHHFKQYTAELVKFMTDINYSYKILAFDHEFHFLFTPIYENTSKISYI